MTRLTLAQMRAKLQEQESRGKGQSHERDNGTYPFWNIPVNSSATLRFLPDKAENDFFWIERTIMRMPFPGVKGADSQKPLTIQVPCMQMYNKICPVAEAIKDLKWWTGNDEEKALARTYYRKKSYLFQGFVVNSPITEENVPENPIRRFLIGQSVFDKIKSGFMNPDIEDLVIDYELGLDFRVTKTKQGEHDNYSTSEFARKTRALNESERAAIEKFGLFDLKTFLPKEPDQKTQELILALFESSVDNELFDTDKFSIFTPSHLRPEKSEDSQDSDETESYSEPKAKSTPQTAPSKPVETAKVEEPKVQETAKPTKSAAEVLAMLKNKQKN